MAWELVGRADELAASIDALGGARIVALTGAPGVGKSRLLAEVAHRLATGGRPTFRALCTEATRTVVLSPFVPLLPDTPPPDPSLLLAAVVDAIEAAAGTEGLLVLVDDAHHLDDGSLALLAVVVASSSAQVVLTTSDDHVPPPALASLLRDDRAREVRVGPLTRPDVDRLVEIALGEADEALRDELWRLSQGNPLVLREVLAGTEGQLARDANGRWTATGSLVGRRVGELAQRRAALLVSEVADALTLVAVGSPVPHDVLAAAVGPETLDALVATPLVEVAEVGRGSGRVVRPAHPLYGEALLAGVGEGALADACRRLVAAAVGADVDPLRVAMWQQGTGDDPDPGVSVAGAGAALGRNDPRLALELVDPVAEVLDPATAALLRGSALVQLGRHEDGEAALAAGADAAAVGDDGGPLAVELAAVRGFNLAFGLRRPAEADAVLAAAASVVEDAGARGRLDAERGVIAGIGGDFSLALDAAGRTLGNPGADDGALLSAYVSLTLAETMLGRVADVGDHARRGEGLARTFGGTLPLAADQILTMEATAALLAGEVDRAGEITGASLTSGRTLARGLWLATDALVAIYAGRLDDAAGKAATATGLTGTNDLFALSGLATGLVAIAEGQQGQPGSMERLVALRRELPEPRNATWLDRALAWTQAATGAVAEAAATATSGGHHALDHDHVGWGVLALHDAVRFGRAGEGSQLADELHEAVATTQGAVLLELMAVHARTLAEGDSQGLLQVARRFAAAGAPLLAADAAAQAATVASETGDDIASARASASSLVWESRCSDARTPALDRRPRSPLSARVLEIAMDAATGATSAQIAEHHYLSVRTVDNHLRTAYRTLGVSGRNELADALPVHAP